jgi:hypothetical protein
MAGAHEPIELATAPPRLKLDTDLEGGADSTDRLEWNSFEVSSFDSGDRRPRHAGTVRDLSLGPATTDAYSTQREADAKIVHLAKLREARLSVSFSRESAR